MPQAVPSSPYVYSPTISWSPRHASSSHEPRVPTRGTRLPKADPSRYSPEQVAEAVDLYAPPETSPILKKLVLDRQIDGRTLVHCEEDYLSSLTGNDRLTRDLLSISKRLRKHSPSALLESPRSPRRLSLIVEDLAHFDPPSQEPSPTNSFTPPDSALLTPLAVDPSIPEWDFHSTNSRGGEASTSHGGLINLGTAAETEGENHVSLLFNPPSTAPALLSALQVPVILPHGYMSPPLGGSLDAMVLQLQDGMATAGSGDRPARQDDLLARQDRQAMPSDTELAGNLPDLSLDDRPEETGQIASVAAVEMAIQTDLAEEPAPAPAPVPQRTFVDASTQTDVEEREEARVFVLSRPQTDIDPSEEPSDAPVPPQRLESEPQITSPAVEDASAPAAEAHPSPSPEDDSEHPEPIDTTVLDDAEAADVEPQSGTTLPEVEAAESDSDHGESEMTQHMQNENEGAPVELQPNTAAEGASGTDGEADAHAADSHESPEEPPAPEGHRSEPAITVQAPSTQSAESTFGSEDGREGGQEEQETASSELAGAAEHAQEASGEMTGATDGHVDTSETDEQTLAPAVTATEAPVDGVVEVDESQSSAPQPDAEGKHSAEEVAVRGESETAQQLPEDKAPTGSATDADDSPGTGDEEHAVEKFETAEGHPPAEDAHVELADTVEQPSSESTQDARDSAGDKDVEADVSKSKEQAPVSSAPAPTDETATEIAQEAASESGGPSDNLIDLSEDNESAYSQPTHAVETRDEQTDGESTVIVRVAAAAADEHVEGIQNGEGSPPFTFASSPPFAFVGSPLRFEAFEDRRRAVYDFTTSPDDRSSFLLQPPSELQSDRAAELAGRDPPAGHPDVQGDARDSWLTASESQLQFEAPADAKMPVFRVSRSPTDIKTFVLLPSDAQAAENTELADRGGLAGDAENVRESWATAPDTHEPVTQTEGDSLGSPVDSMDDMYATPEQVAGASSGTHESGEQGDGQQHTEEDRQHDSQEHLGDTSAPVTDGHDLSPNDAEQTTEAKLQHTAETHAAETNTAETNVAETNAASSSSLENPTISASGSEEAYHAHRREETEHTLIGEATDEAGAGGLGGEYDMVDKESVEPTSQFFRKEVEGELGEEVEEDLEAAGGEQGAVSDQVEDSAVEDGWTSVGTSPSSRLSSVKTFLGKGKDLLRTALVRSHSASEANSAAPSPIQDSEPGSPAGDGTTTEDGGDEGGEGEGGEGEGDGGDEDEDETASSSTQKKTKKKKKPRKKNGKKRA